MDVSMGIGSSRYPGSRVMYVLVALTIKQTRLSQIQQGRLAKVLLLMNVKKVSRQRLAVEHTDYPATCKKWAHSLVWVLARCSADHVMSFML